MARPSSSSIPPLAAGVKVGDRFEVLGVLGEGGAGTVYDALRLPEQERIALKVLHGHLLSDRQFRGRFEREARILRHLEGPHVCPLLDFGELPDPRDPSRLLLYMALPKIDGPPLDAVLRREGPLPTRRALDIILQILDALRMAHAQGIVHRDLKPANVLLKGGSHVVVVDFGLAKIVTGDTAATVLTAHNMVCGTPEYMAPEQARGDEIDARCDLYAAGVILYQMLTGSPPFVAPTPLSVLTAHLTMAPVPPREKAPDRQISLALEAVVLHALAKNPGDRYSTAAEMAAAVLHAQATPGTVGPVHPESLRVRLDGDGEVDDHGPTFPALPDAPTPPPSFAPSPAKLVSAAAAPRGFELGPLGWKIVWVVAALASICVGVWLSLRAP